MKLIDYKGKDLKKLTEKFWDTNLDLEIEYIERVMKLNDIEYALWATDIPDNWNTIAFEGQHKIMGGLGDWTNISPLNNPTWLDVWKACDKSIRALGPAADHTFISVYFEDNIIKIASEG